MNLLADSEMGKELGRVGYFDRKHESGNAVELRTVKWMDNRGVTLVSMFVGTQPLSMEKSFGKI